MHAPARALRAGRRSAPTTDVAQSRSEEKHRRVTGRYAHRRRASPRARMYVLSMFYTREIVAKSRSDDRSRAESGHCGKPADGSANETTSARAACIRAGCDNRAMQDDIPCPPIYQRRHSNGYARSKADRVRAKASVRPSSETAQGLLFDAS